MEENSTLLEIPLPSSARPSHTNMILKVCFSPVG
jgi:hypothetical protein